jgi:hypothetical protein
MPVAGRCLIEDGENARDLNVFASRMRAGVLAPMSVAVPALAADGVSGGFWISSLRALVPHWGLKLVLLPPVAPCA